MRRRLDLELVRRGLVESRARAQQAIEAGRVLVSRAPADRAGRVWGPGGPVELVVADLSFISLRLVAPALAGVAAEAVLLIKPQFEAGRAQVGRGGIVTDPQVHLGVLEAVATSLAGDGLVIVAVMPSPI